MSSFIEYLSAAISKPKPILAANCSPGNNTVVAVFANWVTLETIADLYSQI